MSQYLGRSKNKSSIRNSQKRFDYIKRLILNQDKELLKQYEQESTEDSKTQEIINK